MSESATKCFTHKLTARSNISPRPSGRKTFAVSELFTETDILPRRTIFSSTTKGPRAAVPDSFGDERNASARDDCTPLALSREGARRGAARACGNRIVRARRRPPCGALRGKRRTRAHRQDLPREGTQSAAHGGRYRRGDAARSQARRQRYGTRRRSVLRRFPHLADLRCVAAGSRGTGRLRARSAALPPEPLRPRGTRFYPA